MDRGRETGMEGLVQQRSLSRITNTSARAQAVRAS